MKLKISKGLIIAIISVVLIGLIAGIILYKRYSPGKEMANLKNYYGLEADNEAAVILQDKLTEKKAIFTQGECYIDIGIVREFFNEAFYYDSTEDKLLYTTATSIISANSDEPKYRIDNKNKKFGKPVFVVRGEEETKVAYISIEFVAEYSPITYKTYKKPNRIVINYKFDKDETYRNAAQNVALRYRAGIKSKILKNVKKGEKLKVIDSHVDDNGYIKAMEESGLIGYVKAKRLGESYTKKLTIDFEEETYTHNLLDKKICLAFHQIFAQAANGDLESMIAEADGVNVLAPSWFQVDGNKGAVSSLASYDYVETAHDKNIQVWGMVDDYANNSKIGTVLGQTTTRQRLCKNIVAEAIKYDLDGINIDFENVKSDGVDAFVQFIREISILCRKNGLVLSIDNYPLMSYNQSFNRKAQAEVADYVVTMAYDEHNSNSEEAGPVASLSYVQDSVKNILTEVPANQNIIALPFYSRMWVTKKKKLTSQSYGMGEAYRAATEGGAKFTWDDKTSMNYASYTANGAKYEMWLEDQASLELKMKVVKKNDMAGMAFWKLGLEESSIWRSVAKYCR
ncbi:MAG: hypothetical protein K6D02_07630 [Lachnospiraceae bacterium]|nr:hypothetical protein [Lachnospiraceae bacterium]